MFFNQIAEYDAVDYLGIIANEVALWVGDPGNGPIPAPGEVSGGGYTRTRIDVGGGAWIGSGASQVVNKNAWNWTVPDSVALYYAFFQTEFAGYFSYYGGDLPSTSVYLGFFPITGGAFNIATVAVDGTITSPQHGMPNGKQVRLQPGFGTVIPAAYLSGPLYTVANSIFDTFQLMDNHIQVVTIIGSPTSGTYTLAYDGQTTGTLTLTESTTDMQTALEALSTIGSGNVTVTGAPGAYTVALGGTLVGGVLPQLIPRTTFSGGTAPGVQITATGNLVVPGRSGFLLWLQVTPTILTAGNFGIMAGTFALKAF